MNSMGEVAVRCVLLVATDGVYDMMSNDDAVVIAFKHWGNPAAAAEEMIVETGQPESTISLVIRRLTLTPLSLTHRWCNPLQSIS